MRVITGAPRLFHQSTALITTTRFAFLVFIQNHTAFEGCCEFVDGMAWRTGGTTIDREDCSAAPISTSFPCPAPFILGVKTSTVR
jgi:hypothetical protein